MTLTRDHLLARLQYDPDTGCFHRLATYHDRKAGDVAGRTHRKGYIEICIDGRRYQAHRLAWLYVHGRWPANQIDHINRDRGDNRLSNLREATQSQNKANSNTYRNNTTGYKGVAAVRGKQRWWARIRVNGHLRYLGTFDTPEDAHAAYCRAASETFGEFARVA